MNPLLGDVWADILEAQKTRNVRELAVARLALDHLHKLLKPDLIMEELRLGLDEADRALAKMEHDAVVRSTTQGPEAYEGRVMQ